MMVKKVKLANICKHLKLKYLMRSSVCDIYQLFALNLSTLGVLHH